MRHLLLNRRTAAAGLLLATVEATFLDSALHAAPDDAVELNAALAGGGKVQLEAGRTYRTSAPLRVRAGAALLGDRTSIIVPRGDFPAVIAEGCGVRLAGFSIVGASQLYRSNGAHGVLIDWRTMQGGSAILSGLRITSIAGSGIIAQAAPDTRSSGLTISGCEVTQVGAHGIIAQDYIDDVLMEQNLVRSTGLSYPDRPGITGSRYGRNVIIRGNRCYGTADALGSSVHGISLDQCAAAECYDNLVDGWVRGYGIEAAGAHYATVRNNQIRNGRYGIGISGARGRFHNENLQISNNNIQDMSAAGIYSFVTETDGNELHRRVELKSNTIRRVSGNAIGVGALMTDIDGLVINGITIEDCSKSGIYLIDCPNCSLEGLHVTRNNMLRDTSHAGLVLLWLKVPANRRGLHKLSLQTVQGNGGTRQTRIQD